jgi:hypothetical protein
MARRPNVRQLAQRQRWLIWLVLIGIGVHLLWFVPWGARTQHVFFILIAFQLILWLVSIVVVVLALIAEGTHPVITTACAILMLAPCTNLLLLIMMNLSFSRTLRRSGLKVGFLGISQDRVNKAMNPSLCAGCGYDLTGNISGVCSECGRPAPRYFCTTCERLVEGTQGDFCPGCARILV